MCKNMHARTKLACAENVNCCNPIPNHREIGNSNCGVVVMSKQSEIVDALSALYVSFSLGLSLLFSCSEEWLLLPPRTNTGVTDLSPSLNLFLVVFFFWGGGGGSCSTLSYPEITPRLIKSNLLTSFDHCGVCSC